MARKVQVGGHLLVTTTQESNLVLDPDTRTGRPLPPWVLAQAHLMLVGGLGDQRRPGSRRHGQGPGANFCASMANSRWVGGCMTTLVEARRPGTKGKLLRLGGLQWVGWGMDHDPGRGATARTKGKLLRLKGQQHVGWGRTHDAGRGAAA